MAEIILPVGLDLGPTFTLESGERPEAYEVAFGNGAFQLSRDEYITWRSCFGDPEKPVDQALLLTRESAHTLAAEREVTAPEAALAELLRLGAVTSVDSDSASSLTAFAQNHRALPMQRGLGNEPEDPELYGIAGEGVLPVVVTAVAYQVWSIGRYHPTILAACHTLYTTLQSTSAVAAEAQVTDVLTEFLVFLPQLLANNCVILDRGV